MAFFAVRALEEVDERGNLGQLKQSGNGYRPVRLELQFYLDGRNARAQPVIGEFRHSELLCNQPGDRPHPRSRCLARPGVQRRSRGANPVEPENCSTRSTGGS